MTTLTDTTFNHAPIVSAAVELIASDPLDAGASTDAAAGTDHAWGAHERDAHEGVTRPHADGVVTNNNDPESMRSAGDGRLDSKPGVNGFITPDNLPDVFVRTIPPAASGRDALATHSGGDVLGNDWVTNDPTGAASPSGNDAGLASIPDGTSNTVPFARTDGSATNLLETMADDDNGLFKGSVVSFHASGGWDPTHLSELPRTGEANGSTNATTGTVSDSGNDGDAGNNVAKGPAGENTPNAAKDHFLDVDGSVALQTDPGGSADGIDGDAGNNVANDIFFKTDAAPENGNDSQRTRAAGGSTALQADPDGPADSIDGDAGKNVANGPAGESTLNAGVDWFFDLDGVVLDVGDVLRGPGDNSNDSPPTRRAGGSASLQADPDGLEGDVGNNVANGPDGKEALHGNIENIDPFVGMVALDVGDVLVDIDDSNGPVQTHAASGGSTAPQADPGGQANGIIAILIGLNTDSPDPLNNTSLPLD
jgi:hypothetical protein